MTAAENCSEKLRSCFNDNESLLTSKCRSIFTALLLFSRLIHAPFLLVSNLAAEDLLLCEDVGSLAIDLDPWVIQSDFCTDILLEENECETSSADVTGVHHLNLPEPNERGPYIGLGCVVRDTVDINGVRHCSGINYSGFDFVMWQHTDPNIHSILRTCLAGSWSDWRPAGADSWGGGVAVAEGLELRKGRGGSAIFQGNPSCGDPEPAQL